MIENSASTLKNSNHISSQFKRKRWTAAKWGSYRRIKGNISTVLIYCPVGVSLRLTRLKIKNPSSKISFNFSLLKPWKPIQIRKKQKTLGQSTYVSWTKLGRIIGIQRFSITTYWMNEWWLNEWMIDWINECRTNVAHSFWTLK